MSFRYLAALALLAGSGCRDAAGHEEKPATLVLLHGEVVTVDAQRPRAQAIAVRDDRILAVGSDAEVEKLAGPATERIDLRGRLAIPAFIEGHGHFAGLGESMLILDLKKAGSWEEIVAQVAEAARNVRPGNVIEGRGWHQEKWRQPPQPNVDGAPLHASLDRVSPANPVVLEHASGHAAFVNARALALAGVTRKTPDPPGGQIVKDKTGEPTGLLRESAQRLVRDAIARLPKPPPEEEDARFRKMVQLAGADALSKGVTTFHDAGTSFATIDRYRQLADEGKLPVRLYEMVRFETDEALDANLDRYRVIGYGRGMLTVRAIKQQVDGALGSHGAWLLAPYADLPSSTGLVLEPMTQLEKTARIALKHGFQVNTHAIGDRANREVLTVYQRLFREHGPSDLRWRIEHAQHLEPEDVPRFKQLGVIASMQGIHIISDGPWVPKRLGAERARRTSYPWRSLIDAGAVVTNGTDTPVEDIDPILSFYGAVSRKTKNGTVFVPEQRVSREEALRAYTLSNAFAAFEENEKGSLTAGKLADLTVLSRNILTVPEDEIPSARVDLTILGGAVRMARAR